MRKKIIVCRKQTERIESIGKSSFLCKDPKELNNIFNKISNDFVIDDTYICPYGQGNSAEKIRRLLGDYCG